eukprot:530231_1
MSAETEADHESLKDVQTKYIETEEAINDSTDTLLTFATNCKSLQNKIETAFHLFETKLRERKLMLQNELDDYQSQHSQSISQHIHTLQENKRSIVTAQREQRSIIIAENMTQTQKDLKLQEITDNVMRTMNCRLLKQSTNQLLLDVKLTCDMISKFGSIETVINDNRDEVKKEIENQFDMSVFEEYGDESTNGKVIRRLSAALKYYSSLDIINSNEDRDLFSDFIQNKYELLIDDFAVLTKVNKKELYKIQKALIDNGDFQKCDIEKCDCRNDSINNNQKNNVLDPTLNFYKITMDSLHFYMFHIFECGLRTLNRMENENSNELKSDNEYFDPLFARVSKMINDRINITKSFMRFKSNHKFTLMVNNINTTNEINVALDEECITYIDELCQYLSNKTVSDSVINVFQSFINSEEYDSEAVVHDIFDKKGSNISKALSINGQDCIKLMTTFFKKDQNVSSSFSIGYRFYYWEYYKRKETLTDTEQHPSNMNHHSNYNICELYIEKKYDTFKEEISNYKYIQFKTYKESVVTKASIYMSSNMTKKTKATLSVRRGYKRKDFHYGIEEGAVLRFKNLVSLLLYTDFSDLSTDMSGTFRKKSRYDTISSLKSRNRKYYWFSRILRETVELFGYSPDEETPFYTGVDTVLEMPSFRIRLCAPTSTTTQIEVALKFSGTGGMVLQLYTGYANRLTAFDVAWISRYKEEDERIYFGGHWPINIKSVRIKSKKLNFENCIGVLYYFDAMLTGARKGSVRQINISNKEKKLLLHLWKRSLGHIEEQQQQKYAKYIYDTFKCFRNHKKQINLGLASLKTMNEEFRNLIMYNIEGGPSGNQRFKKREFTDKTNLFRKEVLEVFQNVKTVIFRFNYDYSLSMLDLLELIESSEVEQVIIRFNNANDNWFTRSSVCSEWMHDINVKYKEKHYELKYVTKDVQNWDKRRFWIQIDKV